MMKPGGGKQKGAAFERKICVQLSLWVSHGARQDIFWRSAMSGGRATVGRKRGQQLNRQAGDICAVAPEGHALTTAFYIECKNLRNVSLHMFFIGRGPLVKVWREVSTQAQLYEREPMLIVKQNKMPILMFTDSGALTRVTRAYNSTRINVKDADLVCDMHFFDRVMRMQYQQ